jgi:opacity protein-like surface antigen
MKSFLLTAVAVMACACGVFAQNLPPVYSWEVGVNGGYSGITRPLGPAETYQGTRSDIVHDISIRGNFYFSERWMIGLDVGTRHWETVGQWQLNDKFNTSLTPVDVKFMLADRAINETIMMNYVIPFYTQFQTYNRANFYFGINAGMMNTVNDGSRTYNTIKSPVDSTNYTYVSGYHYSAGLGYSIGVQTGFTYNIVPRLGVNIELGMRYAHIKTKDQGAFSGNSMFYLLYFPETIGIRWRF